MQNKGWKVNTDIVAGQDASTPIDLADDKISQSQVPGGIEPVKNNDG